jgi:N6-L-threonylcarbamoyladenine synthase
VNVLGIETSCDESGVALVRINGAQPPTLVAQGLHSQVELHALYGGVVPELASRDHVRRVIPLARSVLDRSGTSLASLDVVAYTRGPGLAGALLVGAGLACSLAAALGLPAVAIHHLEGHLLSPFLSADPPTFPFVALLVSGGHTQLLKVTDVGSLRAPRRHHRRRRRRGVRQVGQAARARLSGRPALARLAEFGDPGAYALPRPLLQRDSLDFSFAGLKTAVRTHAARLDSTCEQARADLAASTQAAIVDVLAHKTMAALAATAATGSSSPAASGANVALRARLRLECDKREARLHFPELALCTDNGAMIALAAAMRWQRGIAETATDYAFDVRPRWPLVAA